MVAQFLLKHYLKVMGFYVFIYVCVIGFLFIYIFEFIYCETLYTEQRYNSYKYTKKLTFIK